MVDEAVSPHGERRSPEVPLLGRTGIAVGVLLAEYGVIGLSFDGGDLVGRGGWLSRLSVAGQVFTIIIVVSSAALLLHFRQLRVAFEQAAEQVGPPSWSWLAIHAAAFVACLASGFGLFALEAPNLTGAALVAGGVLSGLVAIWSLARGLFGPATVALARVAAKALGAGAALGVIAWQAGDQMQPLWPKLARATLGMSGWLLGSLSSAPIRIDPSTAVLAVGEFEVVVEAGCSGIEGMALASIFVTGYIYHFRRELLIGRALLLVPLAAGLAWLANSVRIAALVAIGAWWSPDVAFGGFHSKAGWVLFCAVALSTVALLNRSRLFSRAQLEPPPASEGHVVENPSAGYCMPFLVVLAVALVTGLFTSTLDLFYGARLVAAAVALYFTRHYWRKDVIRRVSTAGPLWGIAVFALWIGFTPTNTDLASTLSSELGELSDAARIAWLAARVLGTCAMAPIVEELAFRGFLQRRLMGSEFELVPYAQVTLPCILVSALAFGALHPSLLLGTVAGVGYSLAARHRGGLSEAIIAHGVTNLLLTIWAFAFGRLDLLA